MQRAHTDIIIDDGVPYAKAQNIPFQEIASGVRHTIDHETHVWELASILFDELDSDITGSGSFPDNVAFEQRIRKERLIQLWEKLCHSPAMKDITATSSAEERAVAHLSAHNVVEACDELIRGKDFRLSILVAQIGGDPVMHEDMANQIKEWRGLDVLSEMTEPIRTLYELLSGNTCLCEGKKGPLEDRARSFLISQRFKLDWKRTFGLRLWYAILTEDPIETAVEKYAEDLNTHETKKPLPQFFENQTNGLWTDKGSALREDVLWGLLKIYSSSKGSLPEPSITDIVMPHNMTGNPLDARLSFQLYHALSARFPTADASRADQLAWDFAVQMDAGGEWLWAIFVLLHLTDRNKRQQGIQAILAQRTADIANAQTSEFRALTDEFKIPASWIWEAKALHARSVAQDHVREMECLLLAKNWEEAHKTLCRIVGPQSVIKQDYATLKRLMDAFEEGKVHIGEWTLGGQVYEDFIDLIQGTSKAHQKVGVLKRLLSALPVMVQERVGTSALDETVAIKEMSAVVGKEVAKAGGEKVSSNFVLEHKNYNALTQMTSQGIETWRVLQLPLASDAYLAHTLEMGMQYYKAVMAGGR